MNLVFVCVLLFAVSSTYAALVATICEQSSESPQCDSNCQQYRVDERKCLSDPNADTSYRIQCIPFPKCFSFTRRNGSCQGPLLEDGLFPCDMCMGQSVTRCNASAITQLFGCDDRCDRCSEATSIELGSCERVRTSENTSFLTVPDKEFSGCEMASMFVMDSKDCSGPTRRIFEGSGKCFVVSRHQQMSMDCHAPGETNHLPLLAIADLQGLLRATTVHLSRK